MSRFIHPRFWPTWIGLGILRVLSLLPFSFQYRIGSGLGWLTSRILTSRRQIALKNVSRCFVEMEDADAEQLIESNFRWLGRSVITSGVVWWGSEQRLRSLVRLVDQHHYENALASCGRVVLLAPHFVSPEIAGIFLNIDNVGVSIYQRTKNVLLDSVMLRARGRFGGQMFERKDDLKRLLRALRKGATLYYLPDQDPGPRRAVFAPFFGIQTATWPALGRLVKISNAIVIPCATRLIEDGKGWEIAFGPPVEGFTGTDPETDAAIMNHAIEEMVIRSPEQYFWVHKRFKTRPSGEPSFY